MTGEEHEKALYLVLSTWAHDAVRCPVCKVKWSCATIIERDALVVSNDPRRLACRACIKANGLEAIEDMPL